MARKHLTGLRAAMVEGRVELTAWKSTPAFEADLDLFGTIRIYRRQEPDFAFGSDYREYFDGLSWQDAELIYAGPLEARNRRKYTFIDWDARPGETFVYWMAAAEGEPVGPVPIRVRDPEVWWSQDRLAAEINALCRRFPELVQVATLGRTVHGRPIQAIRAGLGERCIALVGAIHAGESGAELMLPAIERLLAEVPILFRRASLVAIPVLNLDQRQRLVAGIPWYLRTNANGVDLNRNFPADWSQVERGYGYDSSDPQAMTYRGPCEASEPETLTAMDFLEAHCPAAVFSFHALASLCGHRFLAARAGASDNRYAAACREFAEAYGSAMDPDFRLERDLEHTCTAGSLAAWCYRELAVPALDVEISPREKGYGACQKDETDLPLLAEYRDRHQRGLRAVMEMIARA